MVSSQAQNPIFLIRFLFVGVPYHSEYLDRVTDTVAKEDLEDEELWERGTLMVMVSVSLL